MMVDDEGEDFMHVMAAQGRKYGSKPSKAEENRRRQNKVGKSTAQRKRSEARKDQQHTFRTYSATIDLIDQLAEVYGIDRTDGKSRHRSAVIERALQEIAALHKLNAVQN